MRSTIRTATAADRPAICNLLAALGLSPAPAKAPPGRSYTLVLDGDEGLAGCAELVISAGPRAHLTLLAIDPRFADLHIEERLFGVAEAMSVAFGARGLDISPALAA